MAGSTPLKTAMIGLRHGHVGSIGPENPGYIASFRGLEGVEVVAYCEDVEPQLLEPARRHHPTAHLYTSVDELIAHEDFDVACIVLPAYQVAEVGIKLAEAGKHFYMEKQFARTAEDLKPLVRAVRRTGVKVMLGYMYRSNPAIREVKRFIDGGVFGQPLMVEARHVTSQVLPGAARDPRNFLYTNEEEGGGILHMLACHDVEVMRFLMGCEVKAVQAMVGRPVGFMDEPLEDLAVAAFEYENGAYGSLNAGYLTPPKGGDRDTALVYRGMDGWARFGNLDHDPTLLTVASTSPQWSGSPERHFTYKLKPSPGYGGSQWFNDWIQGYIHAIQRDQEPASSVEDALHVLQCVDAAYESSRTGRRIEVGYGV